MFGLVICNHGPPNPLRLCWLPESKNEASDADRNLELQFSGLKYEIYTLKKAIIVLSSGGDSLIEKADREDGPSFKHQQAENRGVLG